MREPTPTAADLITFCGRPGTLEPLSGVPGENPCGADGCWVWRTHGELLQSAEQPSGGSLLTLACDVAELYHQRHILHLSSVPGELEVIWLELAADNALLVFLKPVSHTAYSR